MERKNLFGRKITGSQLFRNSSWGMADLVLYPFLMIIATPVFISHLGPAQYGLWMLFTVIVQVMNVMNMGVGDSTIRLVSRLRAGDQKAEMLEGINRSLSLSILLFFLAVLCGFLVTVLIPKFSLFNIAENETGYAMKVLFVFAAAAGLKFIEQVFLSVFRGMERFDIASRLSMISRASVVIVSVMIVSLSNGLYAIALATLVCNLANLLLQAYILRMKVQGVRLIPLFRFGNTNEIFAQNGWYWLQSVIALLGFLSDRLLLGHYAGLETIGYYSIAAMIGSQVHNMLLAFGSFVFPRVSFLNELNKSTDPIYYISRFAIAASGWAIILFLLLSGDLLFRVWLGDEVFSHAIRFIRMYLCFEALMLLIIIPFHFLNGGHMVKLNSAFEMVLRSAHLLLMIIGYRLAGTEGLIYGLIIATIINLPFQYYFFQRYVFKDRSVKKALLPVVPGVLFTGFLLEMHFLGYILLTLVIVILIKTIYADKALHYLKMLYRK